MIRGAGLIYAILLSGFGALQQPRDPRLTNEPSGTAVISGTVASNDPQPRALRRARVMLRGSDTPIARTVITADDGSFLFDRLPAGSYSLSAFKEAYVTMNHGARKPRRPGVRIVVADGQRRNVTIRLPRGAVITGMLTGQDGQPLPGRAVVAAASIYNVSTGLRQLTPVSDPFNTALTDDRGIYRLYGLPAGEYAVMAAVRPGPDSSRLMLTQGARMVSTAGGPARPMTLAPVYFPGTPSPEMASLVTIKEGEERTGVDFAVEYVPVATLEGVVSPVDPGSPVFVNLRPEAASFMFRGPSQARVNSDGRFVFSNVPPGSYTVVANRLVTTPAGSQTLFASTRLVVSGEDISGLALQLQPGLTISGRLAFEGPAPAVDFTKLKPFLPAGLLSGSALVGGLPQVKFAADGTFQLLGVPPGVYRVQTGNIQGLRSPLGKWWLKSVTLGGRELLDAPLTFTESASDGVITFSEHANELSGMVTGSRDGDSPDGFVVVFTIDRRGWFPLSRRVAGVRPDQDGRYSVRNLPAGDYFLVATDDMVNLEWFDPQLLEQLAPRARRITVGAGKTAIDIAWLR